MTEPIFLLDSSICSYLLTGRFEIARNRLQQHSPGEVVTSVIVAAEVISGIDRLDNAAVEVARKFFRLIPVLPFDVNAAMAYADVPFRRGRLDRLVAAHALALNLTIVTANEADFADVPGLRVENWTQA